MQKITACLWFDTQAEEAANFYVSIFKNSKILNVARYSEAGAKASGMPQGTVMFVVFQLQGQTFMALNGGPQIKFTWAVSFMVNCETQEEIDYFWEKLTAGGEESMCGWLKDKYGLSWQIVPAAIGQFMSGPDASKSARAMEALLKMSKIDLNVLEKAYNEE